MAMWGVETCWWTELYNGPGGTLAYTPGGFPEVEPPLAVFVASGLAFVFPLALTRSVEGRVFPFCRSSTTEGASTLGA